VFVPPPIAGCWVGPTILEAAKYADAVYAMEPDFMAYQEAYWNVKLNPDRAAKIDLRNLCISDAPGSLTMYGAPGASMSSMHPTENQKALPGFTSWTIDCMTLDAFVGNQGIDPASIALIKMDTEGHERALLKQLQPWLLKHKPTMLLSMHAYTFPDDTVAHEQIKKLIFSYKTALLSDGRKLDPATFSVAGWCRLCALVLTEEELPAGVDSWEKIFKPRVV
jgi:FkbM family methyltransferase